MPRKPLHRSDCLPYHVTGRANNRELFPIPAERHWDLFTTECLNLSMVYEVEFQAFVLMPNHFHAILTVPAHDLGKVMNVFMSQVTRLSNLSSGRSGHLFGGPYHWSLIKSSRYFGHALKYVYRNPVKAGLCSWVEEYRYSTLNGLLGESHLPFPVHFSRIGMEVGLPSNEEPDFLRWLNTPFPTEAEQRIKLGLRRAAFDRIVDRKHRKPDELLERRI